MTNLNEKEIATSSFIWNEWLWFIAIAFKEVCYQSGQGGLSPGLEQSLVSGNCTAWLSSASLGQQVVFAL